MQDRRRGRPAAGNGGNAAGLKAVESHDLFHAVLVRAAELLGGTEPLARRLEVPADELARWLAGDGILEIGLLGRALDVLLDRR